MSAIDYGALLKVNGNFINKNQNLFMECSDTGYICEEAVYNNDKIRIKGNHYVYAGDKNFLLSFYKQYLVVIHNNKVIKVIKGTDFASETYCIENFPTINIEHLDKNLYADIDELKSWEETIKEDWIDTTGKEKLNELYKGKQYYKQYLKLCKQQTRKRRNPPSCCKYRTQRWKASWEYQNNSYEVIYGYGVDPNERVWNEIKFDYNFTDIEREIINKWFKKDK